MEEFGNLDLLEVKDTGVQVNVLTGDSIRMFRGNTRGKKNYTIFRHIFYVMFLHHFNKLLIKNNINNYVQQ